MTIQTYRVDNLDCANCAAKIERRLSELPEVRFAALNFATGTLAIDAPDIGIVQQTIAEIEPGVKLRHPEGEVESAGQPRVNIHLLALIISGILFLVGVFFNSEIKESFFGYGEWVVFLPAYFLSGWGVLWGAVRKLRRGQVFDEHFLMSIATLGAIAIGELAEAVGVMLFYLVGELLQSRAVHRSRRSIQALLAAQPEYANLLDGEITRRLPPAVIKTGQQILIYPGERVPLDCQVLSGTSNLDTSTLTGEALPREVLPGEIALAGVINLSSLLRAEVLRPYNQSSVVRILELVQNASVRKAAPEKFITSFARYYSPIVTFLALGIAVIPPLVLPGASITEWIYRALVILVISCPCALVVSIPLGYFGGVGAAAKQGILVKGSNYLDALAQIKTVIFDKTGTLTTAEAQLDQIILVNAPDESSLLRIAALAEAHSGHPFGRAICRAYAAQSNWAAEELQNARIIKELQEQAGHGVAAHIEGRHVLVGSANFLRKHGMTPVTSTEQGAQVHVVVDGEVWGTIVFTNQLHPESAEAVGQLRRLGVNQVLMLSGDSPAATTIIANQLGLDGFQAGLLPEEKVAALEQISAQAEKVGRIAYIGDGLNDAPVIARADIGVALGAAASPAAIETADVVIMSGSPRQVADAMRIGRFTRQIVFQNIVLALGVKLFFIVSGIGGEATMWEAVFADMGVALLAILNATRIFFHRGG